MRNRGLKSPLKEYRRRRRHTHFFEKITKKCVVDSGVDKGKWWEKLAGKFSNLIFGDMVDFERNPLKKITVHSFGQFYDVQ